MPKKKRKKPVPLTDHQLLDIKSLVESGLPLSTVAKHCHTTAPRVKTIKLKMKKMGIPIDNTRRYKATIKKLIKFNEEVRRPNELKLIKFGVRECLGSECGKLFFSEDIINEVYCSRCKGIVANKHYNSYTVMEP